MALLEIREVEQNGSTAIMLSFLVKTADMKVSCLWPVANSQSWLLGVSQILSTFVFLYWSEGDELTITCTAGTVTLMR